MGTREENIKIVREACIAANPSIAELEKGCLVKRKVFKLKIEGEPELESESVFEVYDRNYTFDGERFHIDGFCWVENKVTYPSVTDRKFNYENLEDHGAVKYEIIGRPIRLADVLLAMNTNIIRIDATLTQGDSGYCLYVSVKENGHMFWNLLKDDLEEQSDETISFLCGILKQ